MRASSGDSTAEQPGDASASIERVDRRLLELLVCPVTKTSLDYDEARQELISRKARLAYPIRRGVPHMLPGEARHLDD
ncbi:MAG: Trm112 family protein [Hyphomicrobiaceae bacterium]